MSSPQTIAALQAAQSALNQMPRQKLGGFGGCRDTYAVAKLVDAALEAEGKGQEKDQKLAGELLVLMKMMPNGIYSLCEAVADMAVCFAVADFVPNNSRDLVSLCIKWAQAFEQKFAGHKWGETDGRDYIDEVTRFFYECYAIEQHMGDGIRANDCGRPTSPAAFMSHAISNAARIAIELPASMQASAILNEDVPEAARALAMIETGHGFKWENQRNDWEGVCALIAASMANGNRLRPWAEVLPRLIRTKNSNRQ